MTESTKRLQFVITGLGVGGAETLLRAKVMCLQDLGYDMQVVSLTDIGPVGADLRAKGVSVHALAGVNKFDIRILYRLWRHIRKFDPDILHSHLFHANLLGRIIGTICRVPVVISTIHNVDFGGRFRERLLCYTDFLCTATVAISHKVGEAMLEKKVVPKDKLHVIDNGVDTHEFKPVASPEQKQLLRERIGLPKERFVFLSVGRLQKQKGYPYLIETARLVVQQHPEVLFVVLGEGEERKVLEEKINEYDLGDNVQLLGNKSNVLEYLQASDAYFMPSLWEGLPIALLEAMATGLPAVATDVGGVSEVIENGMVGYLVPPKDVEKLAQACKTLVETNTEARGGLGTAARTIVKEKFSLQETVANYCRLYEEFIPANGRDRA